MFAVFPIIRESPARSKTQTSLWGPTRYTPRHLDWHLNCPLFLPQSRKKTNVGVSAIDRSDSRARLSTALVFRSVSASIARATEPVMFSPLCLLGIALVAIVPCRAAESFEACVRPQLSPGAAFIKGNSNVVAPRWTNYKEFITNNIVNASTETDVQAVVLTFFLARKVVYIACNH